MLVGFGSTVCLSINWFKTSFLTNKQLDQTQPTKFVPQFPQFPQNLFHNFHNSQNIIVPPMPPPPVFVDYRLHTQGHFSWPPGYKFQSSQSHVTVIILVFLNEKQMNIKIRTYEKHKKRNKFITFSFFSLLNIERFQKARLLTLHYELRKSDISQNTKKYTSVISST